MDISFGGFRRTGFARADDVKNVLTNKFCGDNVKNLLSGTCSIQSVEFKVRNAICKEFANFQNREYEPFLS